MSVDTILKTIQENSVKFVCFRFTDTRGKELSLAIPAELVDAAALREGRMFDGSSVAGWKDINASDMLLMPDTNSCFMDAFTEDATLNIHCDVWEPELMQGYDRDPRTIGKKAEAYLAETGIADLALFGPESEFFVFDDVRFENSMAHSSYRIDSVEAAWNSDKEYPAGNMGHRPAIKGGYFPTTPIDSLHDIRAAMCHALNDMGVIPELHHHEVGTAGQCEIVTRFSTLVDRADKNQIFKYTVQNTAHLYGKTATFMPKPLIGENGSGMHVHQSLQKDGRNIFIGDLYAGLSETALFYIGGIIKHGRAINAFTNASTNSYKRLVPGYEAPVSLVYANRNRSAAIRIPAVTNPNARRIEVRFPDSAGNPYMAFTALLMAGIDGIKNKIDPGAAHEEDLYHLSEKSQKRMPQVCQSLDEAIDALDHDREFLMAGGVMTNDAIDAYISLKREEADSLRMSTHPIEFKMYYSL